MVLYGDGASALHRRGAYGSPPGPRPVSIDDYEALLDRAFEQVPKGISDRGRWTLPTPDIDIEGASTLIRNLGAIAERMDRDPVHLYQYLQKELGTAGTLASGRVILKGRIPPRAIKGKLTSYVNEYIRCEQCKSPDTIFGKDGRTTVLRCQACGASRPVRL